MWSSTSKSDPWLPPPPHHAINGAAASAFPLTSMEASGPVAAARTRSPAGNSSSSIDGWLHSGPPPSSNAVPVLPAKQQSNDLNLSDAWSNKPDMMWKQPPQLQQQKVPDPWISKTSSNEASLDPWAPLGNAAASANHSGVRRKINIDNF